MPEGEQFNLEMSSDEERKFNPKSFEEVMDEYSEVGICGVADYIELLYDSGELKSLNDDDIEEVEGLVQRIEDRRDVEIDDDYEDLFKILQNIKLKTGSLENLRQSQIRACQEAEDIINTEKAKILKEQGRIKPIPPDVIIKILNSEGYRNIKDDQKRAYIERTIQDMERGMEKGD